MSGRPSLDGVGCVMGAAESRSGSDGCDSASSHRARRVCAVLYVRSRDFAATVEAWAEMGDGVWREGLVLAAGVVSAVAVSMQADARRARGSFCVWA